jgi:hypothetical protein
MTMSHIWSTYSHYLRRKWIQEGCPLFLRNLLGGHPSHLLFLPTLPQPKANTLPLHKLKKKREENHDRRRKRTKVPRVIPNDQPPPSHQKTKKMIKPKRNRLLPLKYLSSN